MSTSACVVRQYLPQIRQGPWQTLPQRHPEAQIDIQEKTG